MKITVKQRSLEELCRVVLGAALILALFFWSGMTAHAAGGLTMTTSYPGMSVKPGDSLSISINLKNSTGAGMNADVSVSSLPEGWDGYLQGGSYQIERIYVEPGETGASMTLHVTVPKEMAEGVYEAVVDAQGENGASASLPLRFTISEDQAGAGSFTSEYPKQEGATGTTFQFSTTLINNGLTTKSYSLSAQAPAGWNVSFTPASESTKIAGIDLESGESKGLTVTVVPPEMIAAGEYTIPISAISADETLNTELEVVITGTYSMTITTPDGLLSFDAQANKESDVTLNITNTGNSDLENVSLTSSVPSGWTVTYDNLEDNTIASIPAGSTTQVVAHVKPESSAITGDYAASFTASCSETSAVQDFRVTVKTSTLWGFAAILIIVAVAGGLGYIFQKYGRR
ncbi:MAG TPA: hypothetical protein IAC37_08900 [Candidatus Ventrimonas merdavium]|nr:hypothetical protein [Candidatus Ventrimonas merdavium]